MALLLLFGCEFSVRADLLPYPVTQHSSAPAAVSASDKGLSANDSAKLLREFQKAQTTEVRALEHRLDQESKELKASHLARRKEWLQQERDKRHAWFKESQRKGPEIREYIRAYQERLKTLDSVFKDELAARKRGQDGSREALKSDQSRKLAEFKTALAKGETPSQSLWPR